MKSLGALKRVLVLAGDEDDGPKVSDKELKAYAAKLGKLLKLTFKSYEDGYEWTAKIPAKDRATLIKVSGKMCETLEKEGFKDGGYEERYTLVLRKGDYYVGFEKPTNKGAEITLYAE
jgi:hypothetical protein